MSRTGGGLRLGQALSSAFASLSRYGLLLAKAAVIILVPSVSVFSSVTSFALPDGELRYSDVW